MVIFVHMASVWVPFTSESKEAIADYDEIRKEIKLALQECGRRLGVFLRRRERAKSEFRRRNIFELYIEEVVEACNRLKGGKLPTDKLKEQLQKIAMKRTGGVKTDELLGRDGGGPEGLPFSIIVTPDGTEGDAPVIAGDERSEAAPTEESQEEELFAISEPGEVKAASARGKKRAATQRSAATDPEPKQSGALAKKAKSGAKRKKR
jgi:DNA topoisomerase-6 subunit B